MTSATISLLREAGIDAQYTWAARNTPEDKQFNLMHNENDIIGHITGCYVVDSEGNKIIAENSENAPSQFDIITEAVIYNSWTDPENRERMQNETKTQCCTTSASKAMT